MDENMSDHEDRKKLKELYELMTEMNGQPPNIIIDPTVNGVIPISVRHIKLEAYREGLDIAGLIYKEHERMKDLVGDLEMWLPRIADVISVGGIGEKLEAWLRENNVHKSIVGTMHKIRNVIEIDWQNDIEQHPEAKHNYAVFNTVFDELATHIDNIHEKRAGGEALKVFIASVPTRPGVRLLSTLKDIETGGRNADSLLDVIFALGNEFYLKYRSDKMKWKTITRKLEGLINKPDEQLTEDERALRDGWEHRDWKTRKDNVRQAFEPKQFRKTGNVNKLVSHAQNGAI